MGRDTIRVENGKTLDKLTLVEGEPFSCTGDIRVNQVIYQRKAASDRLEPWVLPFIFDRIAGSGTFEYHQMKYDDNRKPKVLSAQTTTLSRSGTSSIILPTSRGW